MKIFGQEMQFGTILEVIGLIVGLYHITKTSEDADKMQNELDELAKDSKYGPFIKTAGKFIKINKKGWDDEVLYDEALGEIDPQKRLKWYEMIYNMAVNEPVLFDNFINYLAHLPKERRIKVLLELLENCETEEDLKKIIIARSAHDPNASGMELIKLFRKWFIKYGPKIIETGQKKVQKIVVANQRTDKNLRKSGFIAWTEKILEKSKNK